MVDIDLLTIKDLHELYINKQVTVEEVINAFRARIEEKNPSINAFREVFNDIDEQIKIAQQKIDSGQASILTGIPIAIKDNLLWKGHKVSAGSLMLENYIAPYTSPVVENLVNEGAIIMGRTNMDEFAMGSSTENSAFGPTKNPLDPSRVPGGSSGGSAAAVSMGAVMGAIGSDTGGSIRQPAAFCGIVGMKPTYGTVSRYGLIAMASSLDQIGSFAKNVNDAHIIFNFLNIPDSNDSTLVAGDKRIEMLREPKRRLGIPAKFIKDGVDKEVKEVFDKVVEDLQKAGYEIVEVDLPLTPLSLAVYYIIMPAEVSSNLARFDGIRYGYRPPNFNGGLGDWYKKVRTAGFGKEVRRRSILGAFILSHGYYDAYYNKALAIQEAIKKEFNEAFMNVDAIILPTTPTLPFKFNERSESPLSMYLADLFTAPANIAGLPAISVPKKTDGLPVGIQVIAPHFNEETLFKISSDIEKI